jgi:hypothetical protein
MEILGNVTKRADEPDASEGDCPSLAGASGSGTRKKKQLDNHNPLLDTVRVSGPPGWSEGDAMPVLPRELRLQELQRLAISEPLLCLLRGEHLHPYFDCFIFGPAEHLYLYGPEGDEELKQLLEEFPEEREPDCSPPGPPFVPLWDQWECTSVGVWVRDGRVEFIEYCWDDKCRGIARTEQGLLSYMFLTIIDKFAQPTERLHWERLTEAAAQVGFRYVELIRDALTTQQAKYQRPGCYWEDSRDAVSAEVDRLAQSACKDNMGKEVD